MGDFLNFAPNKLYMSRYLLLLLPPLLFIACNQGPENRPVTTQDLTTRDELSRFSCSDTMLNQLYIRVSQGYASQLAKAFPDTTAAFPAETISDEERSLQILSHLPSLAYQRAAQTILDTQKELPYPFAFSYHLMKANRDQVPQNAWDQPEKWLQLFAQTMLAPPVDAKTWPIPEFLLYAYTQKATKTAIQYGPDELTPENDQTYGFHQGLKEPISIKEKMGPAIINKLQMNGQRFFPFLEAPTTLNFGDELVWGLQFDLFPASLRPTLERSVLQGILEDGFTLDSLSLLGQTYVLPLLSQSGNHDAASRLVQDTSWYMGQPSREHLVAHWLLTEAAGISYQNGEVVLAPKLTEGITFAEGQLQTTDGLFYCRIEKQKPIRIQILSPKEATLVLPVKDPSKATIICNQIRIWLGSQPQPMPEGIEFLGAEAHKVVLKIPRGKFEFLIKS